MVPKMFEPMKFDCILNTPICQLGDVYPKNKKRANLCSHITFTTLFANSADDKLMIRFFFCSFLVKTFLFFIFKDNV